MGRSGVRSRRRGGVLAPGADVSARTVGGGGVNGGEVAPGAVSTRGAGDRDGDGIRRGGRPAPGGADTTGGNSVTSRADSVVGAARRLEIGGSGRVTGTAAGVAGTAACLTVSTAGAAAGRRLGRADAVAVGRSTTCGRRSSDPSRGAADPWVSMSPSSVRRSIGVSSQRTVVVCSSTATEISECPPTEVVTVRLLEAPRPGTSSVTSSTAFPAHRSRLRSHHAGVHTRTSAGAESSDPTVSVGLSRCATSRCQSGSSIITAMVWSCVDSRATICIANRTGPESHSGSAAGETATKTRVLSSRVPTNTPAPPAGIPNPR